MASARRLGTSNGGYVIGTLRDGRWSLVNGKRSKVTKFSSVCYRPVAIFDMNGDGAPEIILRQSEGEWWGDVILGLDPQGTWRIVAESPGGSTA